MGKREGDNSILEGSPLTLRLVSIAAIVLFLLITPACSFTKTVTVTDLNDSKSELPAAEESQGKVHRVVITGVDFVPQKIDIKPGDTVTWVNEDDNTHTVTSWHQYQDENHVVYTDIGKIWDSGDIKPGDSFSRTFDTVGKFEYISFPIYLYVEFQQKIVGVIVVSE